LVTGPIWIQQGSDLIFVWLSPLPHLLYSISLFLYAQHFVLFFSYLCVTLKPDEKQCLMHYTVRPHHYLIKNLFISCVFVKGMLIWILPFYFLLHLKVCNIRTAQNIKAAHLSPGPCVMNPDIAWGGETAGLLLKDDLQSWF